MGKQIDAFCIEKETNLHTLDSEIRQLKREKEQLKRLNEKLVGRCEELQTIINQEASAHTFYYNYPPKPDEELEAAADSETEKLKKLYEEQIANLNRKHEREFSSMIASYSSEVDYLTEMLSFNIKELINLKNRFVETDSKFKEYVKKSDIYIKDKETKLAEVQKEVQEMSYRYQNHGEIFRQEKERADKN